MESISKSLLCLVFFIALMRAEVKAGAPPKAEVVTIQTSAVCESCKNRIEKALGSTDGIISAKLNLDNKKIKVKYDPSRISADQIRSAISNTGYNADGVKANETAFKALPPCCQAKGGSCAK